MRKADYLTLAAVLAENVQAGGTAAQVAETIARKLAARLSVDGPAFLRLCGLSPPPSPR